MINTERIFNIENYFKIGLRRKWYILIPFALSVVVSYGVYKYLPKEYKASTVILVRAQTVPERYVQATLTEPVTERLNTISQEILSRTRLERIVKEFNLYSELLNKPRMEAIVEMMRSKIGIKVEQESAFSISFEGRDPHTVMAVTNKLASMFIEETLKSRESRVEGTAQFINRELKAVESTLRKKEDVLRQYRENNMGQLPEQLDANLRILSQLQEQLKTTNDALRAKEDRMGALQIQIEQAMDQRSQRGQSSATLSQAKSPTPADAEEDPLVTQLNALKRELTDAEGKYTGSHPDVVDLKKRMAGLVSKMKKQEEERARRLKGLRESQVAESNTVEPSASSLATEGLIAEYKEQYRDIQSDAKGLKEEIANLKEEIGRYQKRVQQTPKREQEMVNLSRDYNLLMSQFQSLMNKKYDAQLAENLERKQQGEQFMVLDPARLPERPSKPNRNGLLAMGAFLGLGIGLGLVWFRESMDRSFHEVSEVENYLKLPVVATLLNLNEEEKKAA